MPIPDTNSSNLLPLWLSGRAKLIHFDARADASGVLLPIELQDIPFADRRRFVVRPSHVGAVRGGHGHWNGRQLVVCLQGAIAIVIRDADRTHTITLRQDGAEFPMEPGLWSQQIYADVASQLLVLSDKSFDEVEYFEEPDAAGPVARQR